MSLSNSIQNIQREFSQQNPNFDLLAQQIEKIKPDIAVELMNLCNSEDASSNQLNLIRDVLEIASLVSIALKDNLTFEKYIAQLKPFYYDLKNAESERKWMILGLNLLNLLSQNRISEFHTELELIPNNQYNNTYIRRPVLLEQYLMEGRYNQVFKLQNEVPHPSYNFFMEVLMHTVRSDIAEGCEAAYDSLSMEAAKTILRFDNNNDFNSFISDRDWNDLIRDVSLHFDRFKTKLSTTEIPSMKLIHETLSYAKELERIV